MLSILIPVYNFDVRELVRQLHQQGEQLDIPFEIVCLDDGSNSTFKSLNQSVGELSFCSYEELQQNSGRAKIRNLLAQKAQYPYLLFMDVDSMPRDNQYLSIYIEHLKSDRLLYGGRIYDPASPKNHSLLFHWHYGSQREVIPVSKRQQQPYRSFMTNNFLIPKAIFMSIGFNEAITQYGHEDTLFGMELKSRNVSIIHLDNPLIHIGLEKREIFIGKSINALENLFSLGKEGFLNDEVKIWNVFQKSKALHSLIFMIYKIVSGLINSNFKSRRPSLALFDFFKLAQLIRISRDSR